MKTQSKSFYQFIGAGVAIVASTYGLSRYVFGLFIPNIKEDLGLSIEWLGVIASSSYVGYMIAMAISSLIASNLGPRLTILLGGLAAFLGLLIIAFSTNQWMLMLGVIISGASPGFAYPSLSDAVVLMVSQAKREFAYSIINSGTSIGIILSAPIALFAGEQWQIAWVIFSIIALLSTIWNYLVLTKKKISTPVSNNISFYEKFKKLFNHSSYKIFIYAFILGIVTSSYWVFSIEYITTKNIGINFLNWQISAKTFSKLFWIAVGISGLLGGSAGFFVRIFGLKRMLQIGMLLIVLSIVMAILSHSWYGLFFSAFIFGGVFILVTALIGIWSIFVFYENPSMGFGVAFLILSIGQMIGPVFWGVIISQYNIETMFYIAAFIGFLFSFVKPEKDIYSMTPN